MMGDWKIMRTRWAQRPRGFVVFIQGYHSILMKANLNNPTNPTLLTVTLLTITISYCRLLEKYSCLLTADARRLWLKTGAAEQGVHSVHKEVSRRTSWNVQQPCGITRIIVAPCLDNRVPVDLKSWGKFYISSMFFSSCIVVVTFFNRSLIVACLGKSRLLLYVKYVIE